MAQARKLQEEITRTIKKVNEGLVQFDEIWEKVYSTHDKQKEKFEQDLKKEIKKLQRHRDTIKTWISGNDSIKDKKPLVEARKNIESKMERFKECEKEFKTKKYSNNALSGATEKKTPEEIAKDNTRAWINDALDNLGIQLEAFEAEVEAHSSLPKKGKPGKRPGSANTGPWQEVMMEKHKRHTKLLEHIMREMENDQLDPSEIDELREDIETYVQDSHGTDCEVEFDEYLYETIIEDVEGVCAGDDFGGAADEDEDTEEASETSSGQPAPKPKKPKKEEKKKPETPKSPELAPKKPRATPPLQPQTAVAPPKKPTVAAVVAGTVTTPTSAKKEKKGGSDDGSTKSSKDKRSKSSSDYRSDSEGELMKRPERTTSKQSLADDRSTKSDGLEDEGFPPLERDDRSRGTTPTSELLQPTLPSLSQTAFDAIPEATAASLTMGSLEGDDDDDEDFMNDETFGVGDVGVGSLAELSAQTAKLQIERPPRTITPTSTNTSQSITSVPSSPTNSQSGTTLGVQSPVTGGSSALSASSSTDQLQQLQQQQQQQHQQLSAGTEAQQQQAQQQRQALQMLEASLPFLPAPTDCERLKPYMPPNPYRTPDYYPKTPHPAFNNPDIFEKFDTDTLFFIFYYQQATYQQYLAAHELKKQSWRYHKKYLTWFQRHDQPKVATDEYEQGTYVYFDYETGWCQRIKQEFLFKYLYLENELPV